MAAGLLAVLGGTLALLPADPAASGTGGAASRGMGRLPAVATDSAERSGAHGDLVHLAQTADRGGSSKGVTRARRPRTASAPTRGI
ncbi:hypothetical protein [Streptomyces sp. NPDC005732]|uniref:hypothetical protein n=1 Tax=Streptomyces sp. NPDC005732 TaxID=3157057 RepID=UPI0033CCA812